MKVLLDTHVFLWLLTDQERLGGLLELVENPDTELLLSAVSAWELAIKCGAGRLELPEPVERYVPSRMQAIGATALPIEQAHALAVAGLPSLHRDPFDRLLVAQSQVSGVPILTADAAVARYPVDTLLISP